MTLYLDKLNGIWDYDSDDDCTEDHHWRLVAKTNHFDHRDFMLDSLQNTESISQFAPFRKLLTGEKFDLPVNLKAGDAVEIDYSDLNNFDIKSTAYRSSKHTIIGSYIYDLGVDEVVVSINVTVPKTSVKRYS